jgi:hypothetical protein
MCLTDIYKTEFFLEPQTTYKLFTYVSDQLMSYVDNYPVHQCAPNFAKCVLVSDGGPDVGYLSGWHGYAKSQSSFVECFKCILFNCNTRLYEVCQSNVFIRGFESNNLIAGGPHDVYVSYIMEPIKCIVKHSNPEHDNTYSQIKIFDETDKVYITPNTQVSPKHTYVVEHCDLGTADTHSKLTWIGSLK